MRYIVETQLPGFVQFISLPERGDTFAAPSAVQFRAGYSMLVRLDALLETARARIAFNEDNFHEDAAARESYDYGEVLSSPGDPLLTVLVLKSQVTLLANSVVLFSNVSDIAGVQKALKAAAETL